jgi:hypothetical protein
MIKALFDVTNYVFCVFGAVWVMVDIVFEQLRLLKLWQKKDNRYALHINLANLLTSPNCEFTYARRTQRSYSNLTNCSHLNHSITFLICRSIYLGAVSQNWYCHKFCFK